MFTDMHTGLDMKGDTHESHADTLSSCKKSYSVFSYFFCLFLLLLLNQCPRLRPAPTEAMKEHMKAPTVLHKYCTTQTWPIYTFSFV